MWFKKRMNSSIPYSTGNCSSKMHTLFIFLFLLFIFFNSSAALGRGAITGGWKPIRNITDSGVIDIGKFAVDEHNKNDHASLNFKKLVKGESQVVAGTQYNITVTVVDEGRENNYIALVWDKPWQKFRKLVSFDGPV